MNCVLSSNDKPMIEQMLWLIGNISGENEKFRNIAIQ